MVPGKLMIVKIVSFLQRSRLWANIELYRMRRSTDMTERMMGAILSSTRSGLVRGDEKGWIDKIESIRKGMALSCGSVTMVDYGAGSKIEGVNVASGTGARVVVKTVKDVCNTASKGAFLLFRLIREVRPSLCLELGTGPGISTLYQAAAMELNRHGRVVTLEGSEALVALAGKHFSDLHLGRVRFITGRFQDTIEEALRENNPVDFSFIDGHHEEEATLANFNAIAGFVSREAIVVIDNINWSPGMVRAWRRITGDERVGLSVDLCNIGICVFNGRKKKTKYRFSLGQ